MAAKKALPAWLTKAIKAGKLGPYCARTTAIGISPALGHVDDDCFMAHNVQVGEPTCEFSVVRFGDGQGLLEITVRGKGVPLNQFIELADKLRKEG